MGDGTDDPTIDSEGIFADMRDKLDELEDKLTRPVNYICLVVYDGGSSLEVVDLRDFDFPEGFVFSDTDGGSWSYRDQQFKIGYGNPDAARYGWPIIGVYDKFLTNHLQQVVDDALENAEYLG